MSLDSIHVEVVYYLVSKTDAISVDKEQTIEGDDNYNQRIIHFYGNNYLKSLNNKLICKYSVY